MLWSHPRAEIPKYRWNEEQPLITKVGSKVTPVRRWMLKDYKLAGPLGTERQGPLLMAGGL